MGRKMGRTGESRMSMVHPTVDDMVKLAENWRDASHREAYGMMSATAGAARSHDAAKAAFIAGLANLKPRELADALCELSDLRTRLVTEKRDMRRTLRDAIVSKFEGSAQDYYVTMRWSKEFYDQIQQD